MIDLSLRWQVICGDALQVLRELPDGCVDAVVTDPPYGMAYQSAWRTDKNERFDPIANDDAPFVWFLPHVFRVLKPGGCLLCFCRWDGAEAFRQAIRWAGLDIGGQLVWDRLSHGMGDLKGSPAPQHDTVWFATKGGYRFHGRRPKSVIRSMRLTGDKLDHPNEKPVDLMVDLVHSYAPEGGIVVDPMAGSGTTGVACMQTGRRFIGVEIDSGYCDIARRRIEEASHSLFDAVPAPKPVEQAPLF